MSITYQVTVTCGRCGVNYEMKGASALVPNPLEDQWLREGWEQVQGGLEGIVGAILCPGCTREYRRFMGYKDD